MFIDFVFFYIIVNSSLTEEIFVDREEINVGFKPTIFTASPGFAFLFIVKRKYFK